VKSILAFGVVALALTACGDNGSAAPSPVTEVVATSPTPTTVVEPAPTTTQPIPTTTLPPTTTTVPTEDLIKQAVQDYVEAYHQCGADPAACAPDNFTAAQGHSRATIADLANGMAQQGLYFPADRNGSHINPQSVTMTRADEAETESCWYDAGAVLGPIGPDGLPTIVNDEVESLRISHTLFLENGLWRVGEQRQLEVLGETDACGAG
jgi:hypothetical protein